MKSITAFIILIFLCYQIFDSSGIFNGKLVRKGHYPFVARIFYYYCNRKNRKGLYRRVHKFVCTGSIINQYFVLTAAGCFHYIIKEHNKADNTEFIFKLHDIYDRLYVRAGIVKGTDHYAPGFQVNTGDTVIVHPDYLNQSTMFDVDVALIKCKYAFDFPRDPTQVAPAPKWGKHLKEYDYLMCFVAGFGYTSWQEYDDDLIIQCLYNINYDRDFPEVVKGNVLRYYKVRVGRERYCKYLRRKLGPVKHVKGEVFDDFYACASPMNTTVTPGPCYGDIGAPLICSGIVTGVMSQIRSKWAMCDYRTKNNPAFNVFTTVGAVEVVNFLRKYIPDFPELVDIPPWNPLEDYDEDYDSPYTFY